MKNNGIKKHGILCSLASFSCGNKIDSVQILISISIAIHRFTLRKHFPKIPQHTHMGIHDSRDGIVLRLDTDN